MRPLVLTFAAVTGVACAHAPLAAPSLEPLHFEAAAPAPAPLQKDAFTRDLAPGISEDDLRQVLSAPVFLEAKARVGIVPVAARYAVDQELPREAASGVLAGALQDSGLFELASEVSTDWPTASGLGGLRELAARYRADYLVLYRARFATDEHANGWAAGYATLLGALFLPGQSVEAAGVLEATLFDVKTGTILFTALQRVHGEDVAAPTTSSRHQQDLTRKLLEEAAPKLAAQVVEQCQRLAASRPGEATASAVNAD